MTEKEDKLHSLAVKRFERVESKERDQRRLAVEDIRFAQSEDGQWDEDTVKKRENRPRFTINRVAGAIDQLIGDQRQNRTAIKVRPVSGGATEDTAKTMEGIIRNIESDSKAGNAYDTAFDEAVNGGYGGWRVITEWDDNDPFVQTIKIKPLNTATTSLWFDDAAEEYDKRDANWAFVTYDMPRSEHEDKYPNSGLSDWSQEQFDNSSCSGWVSDNTVRVAEYWVKTPVTKEIALLSDGRIIDSEEEKSVLDEIAAAGITVKKTRTVKTHKVEMYLLDGAGVIEGPKKWAGKYIPLIPMFGRQSNVEGQSYTRGIVRFAKDANRIYNYTTSAAIEAAALAPKDPIWVTPAHIKGHESHYRTFNNSNTPFMPYNPDPKSPGAPSRGGAPAVQQAFISQIQQSSMDLYHVTGMQPPALGVNPELKSGKAIQAQERLGDRGSFIFNDNLVKSQQYTGEILIDLIPRIYDTERQVRIMQQDGETKNVTINTVNEEVIDQQTGEPVLVNDLSVGKYDVVAESGPAFATQRQESAQQIIELMGSSPQFEALAMDLVAKDLPILESKELTKRVRAMMISQGAPGVKPTDEEIEELGLNQPQQPDPQQQAITENIQIQTEKLISDIESQDAKTLQTKVDTQQKTIETYEKLIDTLKTRLEAGIPLTDADRDITIKQQDIIAEGQQALDPGPNSEQAADIVNQSAQQEQMAENARRLTVPQPSTSIGQNNIDV